MKIEKKHVESLWPELFYKVLVLFQFLLAFIPKSFFIFGMINITLCRKLSSRYNNSLWPWQHPNHHWAANNCCLFSWIRSILNPCASLSAAITLQHNCPVVSSLWRWTQFKENFRSQPLWIWSAISAEPFLYSSTLVSNAKGLKCLIAALQTTFGTWPRARYTLVPEN